MAISPIIGVFDSGVGGLTVLKELRDQLPNHSYIYVADTANCPYGPKGESEIIRLSKSITEFLINQGCSLIVVACNTATAAAIDFLRANYSIPFVGMEPAVKPAALATKTKSIGVLATAGTFNGRLYRETTAKYASGIKVVYQIGEGLVELVEQGKSNSQEAKHLLNTYIKPMLEEDIDHLVLGCTHYPFFISVLKEILPPNITIINPAPAVAKQSVKVWSQLNDENFNHNSLSKEPIPFAHFYSSGEIDTLTNLVFDIEVSTERLFNSKIFYPFYIF
jgi:glutamate racemase